MPFTLYTWQEILLTLPRFTGSQEKNTALLSAPIKLVKSNWLYLRTDVLIDEFCLADQIKKKNQKWRKVSESGYVNLTIAKLSPAPA